MEAAGSAIGLDGGRVTAGKILNVSPSPRGIRRRNHIPGHEAAGLLDAVAGDERRALGAREFVGNFALDPAAQIEARIVEKTLGNWLQRVDFRNRHIQLPTLAVLLAGRSSCSPTQTASG